MTGSTIAACSRRACCSTFFGRPRYVPRILFENREIVERYKREEEHPRYGLLRPTAPVARPGICRFPR